MDSFWLYCVLVLLFLLLFCYSCVSLFSQYKQQNAAYTELKIPVFFLYFFKTLFLLSEYRTYQISFLLLNFKQRRTETKNLHLNLSESQGERTLHFHTWIHVFSASFHRYTSAKSAMSLRDLYLHHTSFSVTSSASSDLFFFFNQNIRLKYPSEGCVIFIKEE